MGSIRIISISHLDAIRLRIFIENIRVAHVIPYIENLSSMFFVTVFVFKTVIYRDFIAWKYPAEETESLEQSEIESTFTFVVYVLEQVDLIES